ncbi:tetratricopeptide repeat protein [Sulfurirhabdus autotrophica]|uniref:Sel1 repeat-containing protein n=1 Tax=Sulfurirhabdus autotrophica TaxID=1706046 RepID=A0A4R3Y8T9_9PROT|nr:SEL1-like repeat protein [Sulfurirhabdus autotrophica]TCV88092.1 Sel1 repeat-containing protein [Sulfurirhabdus autotrophica]
MGWMSGHYKDAIETARPHAESGKPWAQLRFGIMYENGWGVEKSIPKAVEWYQKAALQKASGGWAEGQMVGTVGPNGYLNQNSDARIAQYNLANIYLKGIGIEKNLEQAYLNIRAVIDETKGYAIFFCCEFAGGRSFSPQQLSETYSEVLKEMSEEQKNKAEELYLKNRKSFEK